MKMFSFGGHTKKGLHDLAEQNLQAKVTQQLLGQVWENSNKILSYHQTFPWSYTCGTGVHAPPKFVAYLVILCFEKRRPKQKYCFLPKVKLSISSKKNLGWLRHCWCAFLYIIRHSLFE